MVVVGSCGIHFHKIHEVLIGNHHAQHTIGSGASADIAGADKENAKFLHWVNKSWSVWW